MTLDEVIEIRSLLELLLNIPGSSIVRYVAKEKIKELEEFEKNDRSAQAHC